MWKFIMSKKPVELNVSPIIHMFLVGNSINMLLLKLASLFDKNNNALSIYYFFKKEKISKNKKEDIKSILSRYKDLISRILAIRGNLIGHHNEKFFYDIENVELNRAFNFTFIEMELFMEDCKKIVEIIQDDTSYQLNDYKKEDYKKIFLKDVEEEMQDFFNSLIINKY